MARTPWNNMEAITGEQRRDYFHILCARCDGHVKVHYNEGVVPKMEATCTNDECDAGTVTLKLIPGQWEVAP